MQVMAADALQRYYRDSNLRDQVLQSSVADPFVKNINTKVGAVESIEVTHVAMMKARLLHIRITPQFTSV